MYVLYNKRSLSPATLHLRSAWREGEWERKMKRLIYEQRPRANGGKSGSRSRTPSIYIPFSLSTSFSLFLSLLHFFASNCTCRTADCRSRGEKVIFRIDDFPPGRGRGRERIERYRYRLIEPQSMNSRGTSASCAAEAFSGLKGCNYDELAILFSPCQRT